MAKFIFSRFHIFEKIWLCIIHYYNEHSSCWIIIILVLGHTKMQVVHIRQILDSVFN